MNPPNVDTREEILSLLSDGCEIEHALACAYLYAAMSLKADLIEGGITWEQQQITRRWAAQLYFVASQEMLHLAQAWNLLAAIGGAPWLLRGRFPITVPVANQVSLEAFSPQTLNRFIGWEKHSDPVPLPHPGTVIPGERFRPQSVGELYARVEQGVRFFSQEELFVGADAPQLGPAAAHFPDLVVVRDRATALTAIARIRAQGEGTSKEDLDCHHGIFMAIKNEYERLQRADPAFAPVRSAEQAKQATTVAQGQALLFDDVYLLVMRMMAWAYVASPDDASEAPRIAGASIELMVTVLKPMGDMLFLQGASPEFELGRVLMLPTPAKVASRVVVETLRTLAARIDEGFLEHGWRGAQVSVPLRRIADRFARHMGA
jgi:hypothetical protein